MERTARLPGHEHVFRIFHLQITGTHRVQLGYTEQIASKAQLSAVAIGSLTGGATANDSACLVVCRVRLGLQIQNVSIYLIS